MGNETRIELLEQIIEDFNKDALIQFYRLSSDKFRPVSEDFSDNLPKDDERFETIEQIGRIEHEKKAQTIAFFISSVSGEISERDSKKRQYDIGKKILKDNFLDAGIFVFYGKNNFRLSLIAASYSGPKRKFTTFKRYTYFVSPELKNKTFKDQLKKCDFSSIEAILEAFSIEAVNKDFYTQIAERFTDLVGGWLKTGSGKYEREGCLVWPDNRDEKRSDEKRKEFAVRLIGRLVFCWFLKKKHSEHTNIPLIPNDILSLEAANNNDSYYHFVLEPLFFQVLNKKLNDRHKKYKSNGWDKIPFLNGGLFTPHSEDYYNPDDFQGVSPQGNMKVPDEWLRELLEIFERYNFTIDENTPVDIEISIDPEMLGRIFEQLLALINPETGETARKSTGSYYTPRPIVEYMVDQSIKQYLLTQTNIPEENIDLLLSYSDEAVNTNLTDKQNDSIIDALDKLKVLDPACGSGAFPIGILQKILLILQKVDPESTKWKTRLLEKIPNTAARKALTEKLESETWQYIHKLGVIQSSIYGVDIQPIAAEISKLRIFLSLIVDETVNDDKDNRGIEPLPNLKFKFVCGNSLIDKFMGRIIKTDSSVQTESKKIIDKLTGLKADFFSAEKEEEKVEYNLKILQGKLELAEQLLADLRDTSKFTDNLFGFEAQTKKEKKEKKEAIIKQCQAKLLNKAIENTRIDIDNLIAKSEIELIEVEQLEIRHFKESFIWKMDFAEIFAENNGFDIVIGNPPYISISKLTKEFQNQLYKLAYKNYTKVGDIYCLFFEKGIELLRVKGIINLITSNQWLQTEYGKILRNYFVEKTNPLQLINFGGLKVFQSATVDTSIFIAEKERCASVLKACHFKNDYEISIPVNVYFNQNKIVISNLRADRWFIGSDNQSLLKEKIKAEGILLNDWNIQINYGIKTGFNKAFIIDEKTKNELIKTDKRNAEIIKPLLRGRDLRKWGYQFANLFLINTHNGIKELKIKQIDTAKDYPVIFAHLSQFKKDLIKRQDKGEHWSNLRSCTYFPEFENPKIIYPETTVRRNEFSLDIAGMYLDKTCFMITGESLCYLNAVLTSKLMEWYLESELRLLGKKSIQYSKQYIENIPVPKISEPAQRPFITLVDRIYAITKSEDYQSSESKQAKVKELEAQIDQMVYKLYGLTKEEKEIVENSFKASRKDKSL